jgi:hypothetical protein
MRTGSQRTDLQLLKTTLSGSIVFRILLARSRIGLSKGKGQKPPFGQGKILSRVAGLSLSARR